ncbi:tyrosine-type recombinase/integrase [Streptomyces iconiensis]|uniref:Site-specific integrase n=1 Tax=Streptomyces iconiensis TaxID=1384038 RepID=A0ABT7A2M0_9ACTN|nr:site-specific integrase [Streptomyces iconiensis]MDJ1135588.1 site-specific integrase [Streptomyces iconiensis]
MASIRKRKKSDGTMSYTVLFRAGGAKSAKQESEVFDDETAATRFRDLVNGHGQQWPPSWMRGRGFAEDVRTPDEMFEPFAMKVIDLLSGMQGDTRGRYRRYVQRNMSPWFKPYSVRDGEGGISREMVQRWVDDLKAGAAAPLDAKGRRPRTKYAPKTIKNQHGVLHQILQAAVEAEPQLRTANPCEFTSIPRLDSAEIDEEMVFLEREEFGWLQECIAEDAKEMLEAFGETGARWGEVTALQPRDLRRRSGRPAIRIQRAWKKDEDGKAYLGAPKTRKSRRTIVVTEQFWQKLRLRAKGKAKDDLLFTAPRGGQWDAGTFRRQRWVPAIELAVEKYGLIKQPRVHDLRHSHASWLIAAKVPLPAIQGRLGHESITTTVDRYGHLLDALDDEIMSAVAWAMDPTAPLPNFLAYSGRGEAAAGMPPLPQPRSGDSGDVWIDAGDLPSPKQVGAVFVVTLAGQEVPFSDAQVAQDVLDQWMDDHDGDLEAMRTGGCPGKGSARGADGPEERPEWTGDGPVWTRMPDRQFVHHVTVTYGGALSRESYPLTSRWTWEFEIDSFTTKAAEYREGPRPGCATEAHIRGINGAAVKRAAEEIGAGIRKVCEEHSDPARGAVDTAALTLDA